ncbi:MAG: peptidoglycan DD-metalloendopeptidase family protein [Bacteroidetes bacterium]|nr:peptidoglycan DD-metalloendopeptidase family protein [Bacteroidota bacterium]
MKQKLIYFLLIVFCAAYGSKNNPDSLIEYKIITKKALFKLIDSLLEKTDIKAKDVDLLNYYSSVLKYSNSDTVKLSPFNLNELSFYSKKDETALFPLASLDSIQPSFNLILENDLLSFYNSPHNGVISSNYGWRGKRMHKGIDIDLRRGDKITAAFDGKVRVAKYQGGFGNVVIIMHPNGLESVYAHLSKIKVKTGDIVLSGQTIGLGGSTGRSTGPHLHFELRYKGYTLNPATVISFTEHKTIFKTITVINNKRNLCAYPSNALLHKILKGDSWRKIANMYGITTKQLLELNGTTHYCYLKPGEQLRVN